MNTSLDDAAITTSQPAQPNAVQVARIAEKVAAADRVPGISIAVAGSNGIHYAGAVGYADLAQRHPASPEDQYPWFSMTKIATATAVMRLHAGGAVDLDVPIGSYLPGY